MNSVTNYILYQSIQAKTFMDSKRVEIRNIKFSITIEAKPVKQSFEVCLDARYNEVAALKILLIKQPSNISSLN